MANLRNITRNDLEDYVEEPEKPAITPEVLATVPRARKPTGKIVAVSRQPHVDAIRDDLYIAILEESRRLRTAAIAGKLDEFEFSRLIRSAEALTKLSKDQREQDKADNVEQLSEEEIEEAIIVAAERRKALKP